MSIDWSKIESKPDTKLKVEGQTLLDFRAKIHDLELELTQNKKDLEKMREILSEKEIIIQELSDKLSSTEKNLNAQISDLRNALKGSEEKLSNGEQKISSLIDKIAEIEQNLTEKTEEVKRLAEKANDMENLKNINRQKNREIERFKIDLEQKNKEIENLKKTIKQKENQISKINSDLEAKLDSIEECKNIIKLLEVTISEQQSTQNIVDEIKSIMQQKGFLSDKEFEDLIK